MPQPLRTTFAPGAIIGSRTIVEGPTSRPVGYGGLVSTSHYLCRCACGSEAWVQSGRLREGKSGSCKSCAQRARRKNESRKVAA